MVVVSIVLVGPPDTLCQYGIDQHISSCDFVLWTGDPPDSPTTSVCPEPVQPQTVVCLVAPRSPLGPVLPFFITIESFEW